MLNIVYSYYYEMSIQYEVVFPKDFPPAYCGIIIFEKAIAFTGHVNGLVIKWNLTNGEFEEVLQASTTVQSISCYDDTKVAIGYNSGALYVYNVDSKEIKIIKEPTFSVNNRIWKTLWIDENRVLYTSTYGEISIININGGTSQYLSGHSHSIFAVNKKDGKIISGDYRGNIYLWSEVDGKYSIIDKFHVNGTIQDLYWYGEKCFAAINKSGNLFLVENNEDIGWQVSTEIGIAKGRGNCVIFTQDGNTLYAGTEREIIQFDVASYQIKTIDLTDVNQIYIHSGFIYAITSYAILSYKEEKLEISSDLISYKYKKISLLGHTGTGKSTFCKLLVYKNVDGIFSTFGKRIWSYIIPDESDVERRIILHDHGGQETVIDTFLPFISDSDIILLFYKQTDKSTFRKAYDLYQDLITKISSNPLIYFVQTYIDHDVDEVPYTTLDELLEKGNVVDVLNMSPSNKIGLKEFNEKIMNSINWDTAKIMISSPYIEGLNELINNLVNSKVSFLSYDEFKKLYQEDVGMKIADGHLKFLLSDLSNKGLIEYYPDILEDKIIINDEEFNRLRTEVPILVDHNNGLMDISYLKEKFDNDVYVDLLDEIYSNSGISYKFQGRRVFPSKVREGGIKVPEDLQELFIGNDFKSIDITYKELNLSYLLEIFSDMRLRCYDITQKEGLFGWSDIALIYYTIQESGNIMIGKKYQVSYLMAGRKEDRMEILENKFIDIMNRFYDPITGVDTDKKKEYEFDVALSFAGEQRNFVESVANALRTKGIRVFYDQFNQSQLWGRNLVEYFKEVYYSRSEYCIMFISRQYLGKMWPSWERKNATARDIEEFGDYILPVVFERGLDVPGLDKYRGYLGVWDYSPETIADLFLEKIEYES